MYCCHGCTGTMLLLLLSCERSCRWQNASSLNSMQTDYERRLHLLLLLCAGQDGL